MKALDENKKIMEREVKEVIKYHPWSCNSYRNKSCGSYAPFSFVKKQYITSLSLSLSTYLPTCLSTYISVYTDIHQIFPPSSFRFPPLLVPTMLHENW